MHEEDSEAEARNRSQIREADDQARFESFITLFAEYLQMGLQTFAGRVEVAVIVRRANGIRYVFDPAGFLVAEYPHRDRLPLRGPGISGHVIEIVRTGLYEPRWLQLFARVGSGLEGSDVIKSWLRDISVRVGSYWRNNLIAEHEVKWALEQMADTVKHILMNYVLRLPHCAVNNGAIFRVLEAVAVLSSSVEEGALPTGRLIVEPEGNPSFVALSPAVPLVDSKHVVKLLTLTKGRGALIVRNNRIAGFTPEAKLNQGLSVSFHNGTALVAFGETNVCRVSHGVFRAVLKDSYQILRDATGSDSNAMTIASEIVNKARAQSFGCTIVIDEDDYLRELSGHVLPASFELTDRELIADMASIDGAIVLNNRGLKSFGCLLDGLVLPEEKRSRGSRYNSARRFSAKDGNDGLSLVVISADGPMSIFRAGNELYSDPWSSTQMEQSWSSHVAGVPHEQWKKCSD